MDEHKFTEVKELCDEGLRLFERAEELMKEVAEEPGFIAAEGSLRAELAAQTRICQAEKKKLSELDFVVVVVGIMKAGKSTTINAIVGAELLPNRNTPMTTIPTRIRHTPENKEIKLTIQTAASLTALLNKHRGRIRETLKEKELASDPLRRKIYVEILKIDDFRPVYSGIDEIYAFLKNLNDLARACKDLGERFPYEEYSSLENLPLIETCFVALDDAMNHTGATFTLLYTPGANEAGQDALEKVMDAQIQNASAILLITDYTQLNSEADSKVRAALDDFTAKYKDKIYVLVNKFDESNSNGLDREETRTHVQNLFNGPGTEVPCIGENQIYPVSAQKAYLANRMLLARDANQPLDFKNANQTWLDDFGQAAYGVMWTEFKEKWAQTPDWETLDTSWKKMWNASAFQLPLDEVITRGYEQAASSVLGVGIQKLNDLYGSLEEKVNNRIVMLQQEETILQESIARTGQQIKTMERQFQITKEKGALAFSDLKTDLAEKFQTIRQNLEENIKDYFETGKMEERKRWEESEKERSQSKSKKREFAVSWRNLFQPRNRDEDGMQTENAESDFDPSKPEIVFDRLAEARNFIDTIEGRIKDICESSQEDFAEIVNDKLDHMQDSVLAPMVEDARSSLDSFATDLGKTGVRVKFRVPDAGTFRLRIDMDEFMDKAIEEETRTETRQRRQKGIWGKLCEWLDTKYGGWGWEEYSKEQTYYKIYLNQLSESAATSLQSMNANIGTAIQIQIADPLEEKIDGFYEHFRQEMEVLKQDYQAAIDDTKNNQENIQGTLDAGNRIRKELANFRSEIAELTTRAKEVLNQEELS